MLRQIIRAPPRRRNRRSIRVDAVDITGAAERLLRLVWHNRQPRTVLEEVRQRRNRRSIGTFDSDKRGPTAGVAGS